MFAVAASRNIINERKTEMGSFSIMKGEDFLDIWSSTDCNLFDNIDLDEVFDVGMNEGDVLPDLEMDSEIFSLTGSEESEMNFHKDYSENGLSEEGEVEFVDNNKKHSASDLGSSLSSTQGEDNNNGLSKVGENPSPKEAVGNKGKKSSNNSAKNPGGKRKVKVDWTAELHKRFVEAVEQLGVEKAVPSRILHLMGIQCLTRHNIASHLQKYRSHRKHMVAREAEGGNRDNLIPWVAPTIGFPHFRPLHVWGHPSVHQSLLHIAPSPTFWHSNHHHGFAPIQRLFRTEAVTGIPPPPMYKFIIDVHQPTKESIDAALGDVLAKPWLPLPLGLRPPSTHSVLGELQRQGVSKIPPT